MGKKKEAKLKEELFRQRREEGLMYLGEIIQANRALKEWMLKNTFYSVSALGGVYFLFKDSPDTFGVIMAALLSIGVCGISTHILRTNRASIDKLRTRESEVIKKIPLPVIAEFWAGTIRKPMGPDGRFLWIYSITIVATALALNFNLARSSADFRESLCSALCPSTQPASSTDVPAP